MFIKKIVLLLLSFYYLDLRLPQFKNSDPLSTIINNQLNQDRRQNRTQRKNLKKRKWAYKKTYLIKKLSIVGTYPKAVRFLNQRKLRRMYRNS